MKHTLAAERLREYAYRIYGRDAATAKRAPEDVIWPGDEYVLSEDAVEHRAVLLFAANWLASGRPLPRRKARR